MASFNFLLTDSKMYGTRWSNIWNISQNMSGPLHLTTEGRDFLMWCPDTEFDKSVSSLDMKGLIELIHTLQDAMAVEQQTFESLSQQLEQVDEPLMQQRMSAALCTSQTRLARLCSRNMRCFTLEALKSHQRPPNPDSRPSSPRDSGLTFSGSVSDFEGNFGMPTASPRSLPPSSSHGEDGYHSFKNSLSFFQKAVNKMSGTPKNNIEAVDRRRKRTSRRSKDNSSSTYLSQNDLSADVHVKEEHCTSLGYKGDRYTDVDDNDTYENVLYINGRPQFQSESRRRSHSYDPLLEHQSSSSNSSEKKSIAVNTEPHFWNKDNCSSGRRNRSWTRVQIGSADSPDSSFNESVEANPLHRSVALANPAHSRSLGDVTTCVTLPRRKPVLNFGSVSDYVEEDHTRYSSDYKNNNLVYSERETDSFVNNRSTISRTQSFKEGLDFTVESPRAESLTRAQSLYDGLDVDARSSNSPKHKLRRAPSVEEILESVKSLRARTVMVQSNPDLLQPVEEKSHRHSSHKNKKNSSKRSKETSSGSSRSESRSTGNSSGHKSQKSHSRRKDSSRIPENSVSYYESFGNCDEQYENLPAGRVEVIYDKPKSSRPVKPTHEPESPHYENGTFEAVYENVNGDEPTYMNVSTNIKKKKSSKHHKNDNIYANIETEASSFTDNETYDVPKPTNPIYDTPTKHPRKVRSSSTKPKEEAENTYDIPFNNRSIHSQDSVHSLSDKSQQNMKIEDIFATCDTDSINGEEYEEKCLSIPVPDLVPENEHRKDTKHDPTSSDYIDEGLGESDSRSYYADDQGLEVILEEPEDDYSSSHSSAEDLRRRFDLHLRVKGERRSLGSLEGSEGIGSAEGEEEVDTHSSGASEGGAEEDCASSGIHSEDTSSPGPHVEKLNKVSRLLSDPESTNSLKKDEDRIQRDRCVEIYPETIRQRQRNMAPSPNKVDIKNWEIGSQSTENDKKFLPSVKALRNQFENGGTQSNNLVRASSNSSSTNSLVLSSLDNSSGFGSLNSSQNTFDHSPVPPSRDIEEEHVEPIFSQFQSIDDELKEMMSKPPSTQGWNPASLLKKLYHVPEAPKIQKRKVPFINIEGYLEKLPSGRKKATFWNAWKKRYFVAKDGVLYYYQNNQIEKPSMKLPLMGGKIEVMDANIVTVDDGARETGAAGMLGIDDGKGHYVVVRCESRKETERWKKALETHTLDDFSTHYIQPWPLPTNPTLLRDTLVIDIGSCSVRAGVLASQPTLPQLFFPSVVSTHRETKHRVWGTEALSPEVRSTSTVSFPIRPTHKISKFSVDLAAVSSLLQKSFRDLKVDPKNYNIQLSVPRVLNPHTQAELLKILFEKYGVKAVNLTHQSILALYAYNATSGIVVDVGERMDVVPVIDGYIVDGGVSRVPYGGSRIMDHIRQFLYQKNISLINEVDSYIIREVLESICYCAQHYNTEKQRCALNSSKFEKSSNLSEYLPEESQFDSLKKISMDFGRFQSTEGMFNPDAWGLDHPGLHKLVHKAIQECSMDARKEMSRSIFLAGGVTLLPGVADRLSVELDNLTPPAIRPKVHASPYRYHAAYLGACVLAESPAFIQTKITKEEWIKQGSSTLRKWSV